MPNNSEKIVFTTEDNEKIEFFVLEQTRVNEVNYLLIADSEDEDSEANALILKEREIQGDDAVYDIVENEEELDAISKVFETMMDDIDIAIDEYSEQNGQ